MVLLLRVAYCIYDSIFWFFGFFGFFGFLAKKMNPAYG